ncbi:MAG: putative rane protein [Firmicutes bacterium]|nr:putative rane protein [Bacillota bacterium]
MNSYHLKLIAIVTMLIDHVGAVFVPSNTMLYLVMRSIGRLAFPIFVFLLVEGFHHTSNVKKYLLRLGAFAFLSEIPFDLAFYGKILEFTHQNIFFTLFLGLSCMYLMSEVEKAYGKNIIIMNLLNALLTLVFSIVAYFMKTDYGYAGILLIVGFYLFRGSKILLTFTLLFVSGYLLKYINVLATLAMVPIAFYNGKKGKSIKYAFYIFYPEHLLVLAMIKLML